MKETVRTRVLVVPMRERFRNRNITLHEDESVCENERETHTPRERAMKNEKMVGKFGTFYH